MKTWQDVGFKPELTGDGSVTLRLPGDGEWMHHSGGALEETLMIYGEPLREAFSRLEKPRIFSLGLGLGYVEWVVAAESVRAGGKPFELLTMESERPLVDVFLAGLRGELPAGEVKQGWTDVAERVAAALDTPVADAKKTLLRALTEGRWRIDGALGAKTIPTETFNVILYDAFSAKTCPELWTDEFLTAFLKRTSAADALLSTYACKGSLKRALKVAGFELVRREGFKGKKNSSQGRKGLFRTPSGSEGALTLPELTERLQAVIDGYADRFGIETTQDWYILKMQEELGELVSSYLKLSGRARPSKKSAEDIAVNLEEEVADVLAMGLLFAKSRGIDVEKAMRAKWFKFL